MNTSLCILYFLKNRISYKIFTFFSLNSLKKYSRMFFFRSKALFKEINEVENLQSFSGKKQFFLLIIKT